MPVTEQGQQIVTDINMADGAQERPESSKPQISPKGQRQSNTLQKEVAEVDSSASSCEPDSPASTQHLMPGTMAYRNLKMQHGGESPPITMRIGFWNVRCFNRPLKHNGVAHLIKNNRLCLLGILEMKLTTSAIARIINQIFPGWCQTNNFDVIAVGRILIIWNPAVINLVPEDISPQVIHCRVKNKSSKLSFYISFTYVFTLLYIEGVWEKLLELGQPMNMPWLILGDFNCVKSPTEKQLGATPTWYELKDFADCRLSLGLNDAPTTGCYFTWYSNSESNPVWCKLDRVLFNNEWLEVDLLCNAHFSPLGCLSDHSPDHQDFMATVENGWNLNVEGTTQFCLCRKLKALKGHLKAFNNLHFSHISVRAKDANLALEDAQIQLESDPENATIRDSVRELRKKPSSLPKQRDTSTTKRPSSTS
ncbi:UNVERIFIED_CONTAM: hypothetical protein Sangu_1741900 [Sesamum angustifolium]|uniref:Endonuclease/exonuclease/phosphatase domain-containing protein n=1 Tax=Sesamum angustifolium TaxID=2727405 RepID=A0AAW2M589_9LAMI